MSKRVLALLLVLFVGSVAVILLQGKISQGERAFYEIAEKYKPSSGIMSSIANETGVEEIKDIAFSQDEENIKVYFGEYTFDLKKEELKNPNIIKGLEQMEITYKVTPKGNFMFYWKGQRVGEVE